MGDRITVGLIAATPPEGAPLASLLGLRSVHCRGLVCLRGRWSQADIIYITSGIGKTNAAHAAAALIRDYSPSMVINFGVGGGYPDAGLAVGDLAVATAEVYADEGVVLREGFRTLEAIGIPLATVQGSRYFNEFPLDRELGKRAYTAALNVGRAASGVFATVSACSGTRGQALLLQSRFGAICENMEGAAVAHICRLYDVPCVEVRGISNIVEDRNVSSWDIPLAAGAACRAVKDFLGDLPGGD